MNHVYEGLTCPPGCALGSEDITGRKREFDVVLTEIRMLALYSNFIDKDYHLWRYNYRSICGHAPLSRSPNISVIHIESKDSKALQGTAFVYALRRLEE